MGTLACSEATPPAPAPDAPDPPAAARDPRPNLLLVTLDTTRADALGAYGQERATTPALDALAARGALFEAAYSASPSTLPSHATILTGLLPPGHGVRSNTGYALAPGDTTLAEILAERGYATAAEVAAPVIGRRTGLDQGFAAYRDPDSPGAGIRRTPGAAALGERDASDVTRRALDFLRAPRSRPFFLWLHYFDPHRPYAPPAEARARVPDSAYHAEVRHVDDQLGRVFRELEQQGIAGRTLVVVTADHGEGLGEHDEDTHSVYVWDTTVRVPLIFAWPGEIPAGRRIDGIARTADIVPTLLALLGLPEPPGLQGVSLAGALRGGAAPALDAYGESLEPHALFGSSALRFLRRDRWKLVYKDPPELYDLARDASEQTDRSGREPERVRELAAALRDRVVRDARAAGEARSDVDDATRAQLEALGYAAVEPSADFDDVADVARPRGPDPHRRTDDVRRFAEAGAALRGGRPEQALPILRALAERNPQSPAIALLEVNAGAAAGIGAANLPAVRRAIALMPTEPEPYGHLAETLAAEGDVDGAVAALDAAFAHAPCEPRLQALQSRILADAG
ncbi:MAG: sulfatase-like hydrolase/transferase, partial [Myxococcota bacterium]